MIDALRNRPGVSADEMTVQQRKILEAASMALAEDGLDGASLRKITSAAGMNVAAVNYYFRSKKVLMYAVLDELAGRINRRRAKALDAAFARAAEAGELPDISEIVEIFISAYVEPEKPHEGDLLMKLLLFHRSAPNDVTIAIVRKHFNPLSHRFIDAFAQIVPGCPREDLTWRYFFMVGAVFFAVSERRAGGRIGAISNGAIDPNDIPGMVRQLTSFLKGGLAAAS